MRNEEARAAGRQNVLNKYDHHSSSTCRTCEARALTEIHCLHALGEHDLVDSTCGREGKEREKYKVRNEEARAAGRLKPYFKIWEVPSLRRCRTCHARPTEVQVLHAHGKMPLRKVACDEEHRATR